jgi:hypothetical protein
MKLNEAINPKVKVGQAIERIFGKWVAKKEKQMNALDPDRITPDVLADFFGGGKTLWGLERDGKFV